MRLLPRTEFGYMIERTIKESLEVDSRWSYVIIAGLILIGIGVNIFLPHGWTIWPFVGAAGMVILINEAAERNNEGVPPLKVYGFFAGVIGLWICTLVILSVINPVILIVGIICVAYYAVKANLVHRERLRLIEFRRQNSKCVHCGEDADPEGTYCLNCGEEPNPEVATLRRVAAIVKDPARIARARSLLTPAPVTSEAAKKEKALLGRKARTSKG